MKNSTTEYGFSLGSNLGDRLAHLCQGRDALLAQPDVSLLACAPLYDTDPVGVQPEYQELSFLNTVVVVESKTPLNSWLEIIHEIEYTMGRRRQADRNAPRPIDIDLLYAGDRFLDDEHLTVPHPRWQERAFVVIPLADVRPHLVLPGAQQSVEQIRQQLSEPCGVRLFKESW